MFGTLEQNGVAERRNSTFMDMVRSMLSACHLPESLRRETLKTIAYILNRVPTKSVPSYCLSCGLAENLALINFIFGLVLKKSKYIIHR